MVELAVSALLKLILVVAADALVAELKQRAVKIKGGCKISFGQKNGRDFQVQCWLEIQESAVDVSTAVTNQYPARAYVCPPALRKSWLGT